MEIDQHTLELRDKILQSMLANKQSLVKRYGSEAEKVMYGKSMKSAKNKVESERGKIRETIQQCLTKPTKKLMEKLDSQGDEWEDPYKEYDKKVYDYEPTQDEMDRFKSHDRGYNQPLYPPQKTPTGWAYLLVHMGLNKWQAIKYGPNKLIYWHYHKLLKENPANKTQYKVVPEYK